MPRHFLQPLPRSEAWPGTDIYTNIQKRRFGLSKTFKENDSVLTTLISIILLILGIN